MSIGDKLDKLSQKDLDRLLEIMDIGISQELDKEEKIMIVGMESGIEIRRALSKLKDDDREQG
jgi:hypothetical protein